MRKLILCLVAVGCIQAAFLFYNSADNEQTSLRIESTATEPQFDAVDEILSTWPRPELESMRPEVKAIAKTIKQPKVAAPAYQQAVYRRQSTLRTNISQEKRLLAKTPESDLVFASEVIRYDDSLRVEKTRNKRSFAAKSFSVIKKPYDWLKALGSKLN